MRAVLFAICFILISSLSYAQDGFARPRTVLAFDPPNDHRFWLTGSFAGVFPTATGMDKNVAPIAKFGVNIGGMVYKFIGLEASFTYNLQPQVDIQFTKNAEKVITSLGQADISFSILLQPSIRLNDFPLAYFKPYIGAGINIAFIPPYSYIVAPENSTTTIDYSPVFKAGVRFTILNFLIGLKAEYLLLNSNYLGKKYDLSNITVGLEMGVTF